MNTLGDAWKKIPKELVISILSVIIAFGLSYTSIVKTFELTIYDFLFQQKREIKVSPEIVMLDIDDESLNYVGRWPWPRDRIATGLETLKEFPPRQVVFDVEFTEKSPLLIEPETMKALLEKYIQADAQYFTEHFSQFLTQKEKAIDPYFQFLLGKLKETIQQSIQQSDKDKILGQAISTLNNVYLTLRGDVKTQDKTTLTNQLAWFDRIYKEIDPLKLIVNSQTRFPEYKMLYVPVDPIYKGSKGFGFTNVDLDQDHILRKIPLFIQYNKQIFPELALRPLLDYLNLSAQNMDFSKSNLVLLKDASFPDNTKRDIRIPLTDKGEMIINWANTKWGKAFEHYNWEMLIRYQDRKKQIKILVEDPESEEAKKIIDDVLKSFNLENTKELLQIVLAKLRKDKDLIGKEIHRKVQGKICFVGLTATATSDIGAIPVDPFAPMVLARANIFNTILQEDFLYPLTKWENSIILLLLTLVFGLIVIRLKVVAIPILGIGIIISYLFLSLLALSNGIIVETVSVINALMVNTIAITTYKYRSSDIEKKVIKSAFQQYLAPKVIQELLDDPSKLALGGDRREITAFFSDVAGFSTISEKLSPDELVQLLNDYLTEMCDIIVKYEGTVDKFEGDAIIAFWGAPIDQKDHARRACFASIDMQKRLIELRQQWRSQGRAEMMVRIGVNSGPAVVGNMGSKSRMDYTMMGDTVNLASRLEGANKFYSTYTMISEDTYRLVEGNVDCRQLDKVRVVGKNEAVTVYELLNRKGRTKGPLADAVEFYHKGLEYYKQQQFSEAVNHFQSVLDLIPDDGPSTNYIDRCNQYLISPPPMDWDGVHELTSKG